MPGRFPSGRYKRWRLVPASRRLVCLSLSSGEVDVDDDPAGWGSSTRGGCAECASRKGALYVIDTIRNAPFGNVATTECAFPYSTGCRMRFSVECAFPHLRKRRPTSRKSAFWQWDLTQKRTLTPIPHGKPHSGYGPSRKSALYVIATTECAFPYGTGCRMRFSVECAFPHLRKRRPTSRKSAFWPWDLTQKRILTPTPHGKPHSGPEISRKSAFCVRAVTKGRALYPRDGYQKPMQSWLSAA